MELRGSWTGAGKALGKSWVGAGLGLRGSWARAGQAAGLAAAVGKDGVQTGSREPFSPIRATRCRKLFGVV